MVRPHTGAESNVGPPAHGLSNRKLPLPASEVSQNK